MQHYHNQFVFLNIVHTMEYHLAIIIATKCREMGSTGGRYTEWSKPDAEDNQHRFSIVRRNYNVKFKQKKRENAMFSSVIITANIALFHIIVKWVIKYVIALEFLRIYEYSIIYMGKMIIFMINFYGHCTSTKLRHFCLLLV